MFKKCDFCREKLQDSGIAFRGFWQIAFRGCCIWHYESDLRERMQCLRWTWLSWASWCHFSWMLTSLCHVIISFPAIDHKVTAIQWIVPGARVWNFLPKGSSGHTHPWISSQECHLNSVAWCWIMRDLTFVPRQLLNTDGLWAPKLWSDMSRCPGVNWCLSF